MDSRDDKTVPRSGSKWTAVRARGMSMFPLIPDGTLLLFQPCDRIGVGDVVLAQRKDGSLTAHRVVSVGPDGVVTWGDWNRHPDPVWPLEQVQGRCTLMIRKGVTVSADLPAVRLLYAGLAATLPRCKRLLDWLSGRGYTMRRG